MRRPRIGLSGSAGTGKSTLGLALARTLEVPYLPEGMRSRLESGLDLHSLTHRQLQELVEELWLEHVAAEDAAVRSAGGFVADRSSVDFAAFWLHYRFTEDAPATAAFFARAFSRVAVYDHIVLLPWGVLPLVADGVRTSNPWIQRHFQATVEGLLFREVPRPPLLVLPPILALDARVAWICEAMDPALRP